MVAQQTVNLEVVGSSPSIPAKQYANPCYVTVPKGERAYAICPVGRNKNGRQER